MKRDWAMRGAKDLCCVVADEALAQARPCCTVLGGVGNPKLCCTSGQHDKPMSESQIEIILRPAEETSFTENVSVPW